MSRSRTRDFIHLWLLFFGIFLAVVLFIALAEAAIIKNNEVILERADHVRFVID